MLLSLMWYILTTACSLIARLDLCTRYIIAQVRLFHMRSPSCQVHKVDLTDCLTGEVSRVGSLQCRKHNFKVQGKQPIQRQRRYDNMTCLTEGPGYEASITPTTAKFKVQNEPINVCYRMQQWHVKW